MRTALWPRSAGLCLALLAPATASAQEIPELRTRVVDRAELLSPEREAALEARLRRFEEERGTQVVVHTTPSLQGLDIETYSIRIAEAWKIGRKKLDDGVILFVAPNERKVRIEVGYGLEGAIPDALASRIVQEDILPSFRSLRFADGIERGVESIVRLASGEKLPEPPPSPLRGRNLPFAYIALFILLLVVSSIASRLPGASGRRPYQSGWGKRSHGGLGGGFGGLSGGGGFSGGGGGRFGGGGASGSW